MADRPETPAETAGPRFVHRAEPPPVPPLLVAKAAITSPEDVELRFSRLQIEGRFRDMWPMLAEDAQRSWGSPEGFVAEMAAQTQDSRLLSAQIEHVEMVPEWIDSRRHRSYRNVARLAVRYRVKHKEEVLEMSKDVHLVPAAEGWRALWFGAWR